MGPQKNPQKPIKKPIKTHKNEDTTKKIYGSKKLLKPIKNHKKFMGFCDFLWVLFCGLPTLDTDSVIKSVVFAAFGTQGQRCTTLRRLMLPGSIYDEILERMKKGAEKLLTKIGDPLGKIFSKIRIL